MDAPAWMWKAACRNVSTNVFFGDTAVDVAVARRFCDACPVDAECLAYALAKDGTEAHGVYAGLTGKERTAIRRSRQREAA